MNARGVLRGRARALRNALFGRGAKRAALRPRGPLFSLALVAVAAWIVHSGFAALLAGRAETTLEDVFLALTGEAEPAS